MPSPSEQQPIAPMSGTSDMPERLAHLPDIDAADFSQVYLLIDSILPFEACLYYQVLPLLIEGSRLVIGTVNPDDPGAAEYVKKQLSYINYSISFQKISSDNHRDLLSKYLNHTAKQKQAAQKKDNLAKTSNLSALSQDANASDQLHTQQTFIVDQPEEVTDLMHHDRIPNSALEHTFELEMPPSRSSSYAPGQSRDRSSQQSDSSAATAPSPSLPADNHSSALPLAPANAPLALTINKRYRDVASDRLRLLPPDALMQALLSQVLDEGIGRLYFERRPQAGRILWSRDGVLQAVVEAINPQLFQGVINELKRLTHLSLIPVKKSKQVEIERTYEGQRILLRFRVIPSAHGEEATLQVLRGTALRFYQQQQIDRLGRDALDMAQHLQIRLNEIRDRARHSLNLKSTRSETLPALIELLKQMEAQVQEILATYDLASSSEPHTQAESSVDN
jgi:type II secretory ATPase GspE/PulE/Tfp pilus assembly ATPase PilB-like protein